MPASNYDNTAVIQSEADFARANSRWRSPAFKWGVIVGFIAAAIGMAILAYLASNAFSLGVKALWASVVCYLIVIPLLTWLIDHVFFGSDFPLGFYLGYFGMIVVAFLYGFVVVFC